MVSMNISLTPELAKIVQQKVETGLYNNASEVIREAIRNLNTNESALYEVKLAHLRQVLTPSLEQIKNGKVSEFKSVSSLFKEITE